MEITDSWGDPHSGGMDIYFTVKLDADKYVDVKYPNMKNNDYHDSFSYVMDCEQGGQIYTAESGTDGKGISVLSAAEEGNVLEFVADEAENFLKGKEKTAEKVNIKDLIQSGKEILAQMPKKDHPDKGKVKGNER